jgi:protease IV
MSWSRSLWQYLKTYFTVVGFAVTCLSLFSFIIIIIAISSGSSKHKTAPEITLDKDTPVVVNVKIQGSLKLNKPVFDNFIEEMFDETEYFHVTEFRHVMRKAAVDDRVKGIRLEIGSLHGGRSNYLALHRILKSFAQKKKIDVILHDANSWNYFLASAGTKITLTPAAGVMVPGPVLNLTYFGDALRKIGVDFEVVRAGKYKSAFEPFIRNKPSKATLEQYGSMEAHLRDFIVSEVAAGRGVDKKIVEGWFKQTIFRNDDALQQGLVDYVGHKIDEIALTSTVFSLRNAKEVSYSKYIPAADSVEDPMEESVGSEGIALIEAVGSIKMMESGEGDLAPDYIKKRAEWAMDDDNVKAVVLRVVSPGGSALASEMMWRSLAELAKKKPIVVSMGDVAASGGYYISAPAKVIFADPTTITGSIGVISMVPNFEAFKEKYGVSFHVVTQSDRRALFDTGSKSTSFDKQFLESMTEEVYNLFKSRVSKGRGIGMEAVQKLAQGRVYTGTEAKKLGLVDKLGGLKSAFNEAKKLAGFDTKKLYPVLSYKRDVFDLRDCLRRPSKMMKCLEELESSISLKSIKSAVKSQWPLNDVEKMQNQLIGWTRTVEKEKTLALWPHYYSVRF